LVCGSFILHILSYNLSLVDLYKQATPIYNQYMRVALIQTPLKETDTYPLGLLCLASFIKQNGHKPIIIDLNLHFKANKFSNSFINKAAKIILQWRPDVIGFSTMNTTFPATLLIARKCKNLAPNIPIILGGPEVSFNEEAILKYFKAVDIIIRGEGEHTLAELLDALKNKKSFSNILGITFRENNIIKRNNDRPFINNLDHLPYLDFSLLPHKKKYKIGQIEAGRGCPFQCTFCSTCRMWKRNFRIKSPKRITLELQQASSIFNKDGKSCVAIIHDHLLCSRKVADKFISLITESRDAWRCNARLDALNDNLIEKMKAAGCHHIFIGIESGSLEVQRKIKKNLPLAKLPHLLEKLNRSGIHASLSFILGFPNEKNYQINQTLLVGLNSRINNGMTAVFFPFFNFFKGSALHLNATKNISHKNFKRINILPKIISFPAALALINKYPEIFPSYYREPAIKNRHLFLQKTSILFTFLVHSFPFTTKLLLDELSLSPLQLSRKIIAYFDIKKTKWFPLGDIQLYQRHSSIFKGFIKTLADPAIIDVFLHEQLLLKQAILNDKIPASSSK
jgi:radical SAM superfamily enzyme YgiQ (UPF0313 family)